MTRPIRSTARAVRSVRAVGVVLVIIGVVGLLAWVAARHHRREQARRLVNATATQVAAATDADGRYVRHAGDAPADPWGRPLAVTYGPAGTVESVTVRSAGPDRTPLTGDDIATTRYAVNRRRMADRVGEVARAAGRGMVKGVGDGVRESVARDVAVGEGGAATRPAGPSERAGRAVAREVVRELRDAARRGRERKTESPGADQ